MPIILGAVADEYTGAYVLANSFSKQGLRTVQTSGAAVDRLQIPAFLVGPDAAAADIHAAIRAGDAWPAFARWSAQATRSSQVLRLAAFCPARCQSRPSSPPPLTCATA